MFKRTRYQLGSLRLKARAKGEKCWELRYYEAGERKHLTLGTLGEFPSESAMRKSAKMQALMLGANAESPMAGSDVVMGTLIARYEVEEMPERYSTGSAYKSYLHCHIKPRWESTLISNVKPMAVESWLNGLKLAPKTKSHIKWLMHVIFECAMRWELIDRNRIRLVRVKGGSKRKARPRILEVQEFGRLMSAIKEPYRAMVMIAGSLGLRISEIMGLQWSDFNFDNSTVLVQRGVVHGRVGEVKTEYSKDHLPLDSLLVEKLQEHRKRCYPTKDGWLFANPATAKPYHQEQIQKNYLTKAATTAGITGQVGWHSFRHSYRAWLQESGAPLAVQQELMRHASITTTMNVYGKVMTDTKRQANSRVVQMVLKEPIPAPEQQELAVGA
jgi:integrase